MQDVAGTWVVIELRAIYRHDRWEIQQRANKPFDSSRCQKLISTSFWALERKLLGRFLRSLDFIKYNFGIQYNLKISPQIGKKYVFL